MSVAYDGDNGDPTNHPTLVPCRQRTTIQKVLLNDKFEKKRSEKLK
jgi:hypothetical protein